MVTDWEGSSEHSERPASKSKAGETVVASRSQAPALQETTMVTVDMSYVQSSVASLISELDCDCPVTFDLQLSFKSKLKMPLTI